MTDNPPSTWKTFLEHYRNTRDWQVENWIHQKSQKFNDYLKTHGLSAAVVSVSGGIDSAVVYSLLKYIQNMPNSNLNKVVAVSQPIHSSNWALDRARELCDVYLDNMVIVDQSGFHTQLVASIEGYFSNNDASFENDHTRTHTFAAGQLKSYMRTPVNYYIAQRLTQDGFPAIVAGTGNRDEDEYLGYFCKYGDGAVDVLFIEDLHKHQVYDVAKYLNVPASILHAAPSADLWPGQEDELEMGVSYDFVEFYVGYFLQLSKTEQTGVKSQLSEESYQEFQVFSQKCDELNRRNQHKFAGPVKL
jgi:NAD+ synthase (glutamine-hydrolysing)